MLKCFIPTRGRGHIDIVIDVSPQGGRIVFTAAGKGRRDLFLLSLGDLKVTQLVHSDRYEACPSFSPDGSLIIYVAGVPRKPLCEVRQLSLTSGENRILLDSSPHHCAYPAFSPDGKKIVFAQSSEDQKWDVWVMLADGSAVRRLTHSGYCGVITPRFNPEGTVVYYGAGQGGSLEVFSVRVEGDTPPQQLTAGQTQTITELMSKTVSSVDPCLSPDGRDVVYVCDAEGPFDYQLYRYEIATRQTERITNIPSYKGCPRFMPDGSILFLNGTVRRFVYYSLCKVDAEGGGFQEIAGRSLFDQPMHWRGRRPRVC
jgi:Tol biopolymer transport system component